MYLNKLFYSMSIKLANSNSELFSTRKLLRDSFLRWVEALTIQVCDYLKYLFVCFFSKSIK